MLLLLFFKFVKCYEKGDRNRVLMMIWLKMESSHLQLGKESHEVLWTFSWLWTLKEISLCCAWQSWLRHQTIFDLYGVPGRVDWQASCPWEVSPLWLCLAGTTLLDHFWLFWVKVVTSYFGVSLVLMRLAPLWEPLSLYEVPPGPLGGPPLVLSFFEASLSWWMKSSVWLRCRVRCL